jgi:hypothetical protein
LLDDDDGGHRPSRWDWEELVSELAEWEAQGAKSVLVTAAVLEWELVWDSASERGPVLARELAVWDWGSVSARVLVLARESARGVELAGVFAQRQCRELSNECRELGRSSTQSQQKQLLHQQFDYHHQR